MKHVPRMLLLGSTGRNSGKTLFACRLIEALRERVDVVGIKVTAIDRRDGRCPRGGNGCGVCSSLDGVYLLTEETLAGPEKDTQRLLAAGARRVFWLRVLKESLGEGLDALWRVVDDDALLICESNTLRTMVEPGLFLMFHRQGNQEPKASAQAVRGCVDRLVEFDGEAFDLAVEDIETAGQGWSLG